VAAPTKKVQWQDIRSSVQRAKNLASKYAVDKVHPDEYLDPLKDDWSDLLNRIK
jgi:hypothetical protein